MKLYVSESLIFAVCMHSIYPGICMCMLHTEKVVCSIYLCKSITLANHLIFCEKGLVVGLHFNRIIKNFLLCPQGIGGWGKRRTTNIYYFSHIILYIRPKTRNMQSWLWLLWEWVRKYTLYSKDNVTTGGTRTFR